MSSFNPLYHSFWYLLRGAGMTLLMAGVAVVPATVFGLVLAFLQWLDSKRKGDVMIGFLHGLKTGELTPLQKAQVDDMLARFDPPKTKPK